VDDLVMAPIGFHVDAARVTAVTIPFAPVIVSVEVVDGAAPCSGAAVWVADGSALLASTSQCATRTSAVIERVVPGAYRFCTGAGACTFAEIDDSSPQQSVVIDGR
jgi:hypothetical protein